MSKVATLKEIDEHYTICDLLDAHISLDIEQENERKQYEDARKK